MARRSLAALLCTFLTVVALRVLWASPAFADEPSPAGAATSVIVIFPPSAVVAPVAPMPGLMIGTPPGGLRLPGTVVLGAPGPVIPNIMLLTPTPSTGSLIVPVRVAPASGSGPSLTQLQLIIPGPNPAQNTTVGLAQLLNALLASAQAGGAGASAAPGTPLPFVTVVTAPSKP